ncbi:hypothetical protein AB6A40_001396 [Gnathostoma spinigerum]|uniref:Uncharacterized protein n=1 Tax=Gnathostoma spinigerum TaxID=75299 RepID=A0ABD6EDC0_9BILA
MDAATVIKYAKEAIEQLMKADAKLRKRIQSKMKTRTMSDVAVLETVIERCYQSSNRQLLEDLEKHNIPKRIEKVSRTVCATHYHCWTDESYSRGPFTLITCAEQESQWNSNKALRLAAGAVGGIFMLGIPLVITARINYSIIEHVREIEEELTYVIKEIETLYDQIDSIMIANLV